MTIDSGLDELFPSNFWIFSTPWIVLSLLLYVGLVETGPDDVGCVTRSIRSAEAKIQITERDVAKFAISS